jgi:hypothetical protein
MPAKKPSEMPKGEPRTGQSVQLVSSSQPQQAPPVIPGTGAMEMNESRPKDLCTEGLASASTSSTGNAMPTALPPAAGVNAGGITTWQSGKLVTALWSINQNRNVYICISGVGWKKLANNSDSAIVALNILGTSARLTQTTVNYREEADGMIHEIYVW